MCMTGTCLQVRKLRLTGVRTLRTFGAKYQNLPYISLYREFHEIGSKVRKVRSPITVRVSEGSGKEKLPHALSRSFLPPRQASSKMTCYVKTNGFCPYHCWR